MKKYWLAAKIAAASALGYLGGFGFAPTSWPVITILSLAGLIYLSMHTERTWQRLLIGLVWGFCLHLHTAEWVFISTAVRDIPTGGGIAIATFFNVWLGCFTAIAVFWNAFLKERRWWLGGALCASIWTLAEWLKAHLLNGFPWLNVGYAATDTPYASIVPWLGVYGASLIMALEAAWIAWWLNDRKQAAPILAALALPFLLLLVPVGHTTTNGGYLDIALVQGNIAQRDKWKPHKFIPSLLKYRRLSRAVSTSTALIVWPESAVANDWSAIPASFQAETQQIPRKKGAAIISGTLRYVQSQNQYTNSIARFGSDWHYDKRRLVPFSEYYPLAALARMVASVWGFYTGSFIPGSEHQTDLQIEGHAIAVNICYELAFWDEIKNALPQAAVIINVSNEAWFEFSDEQEQLLQIARIRALEAGRYIARATNTGITAVINEVGQVMKRLPQRVDGVLEYRVPVMRGTTPFYHWGNQWLLAILLLTSTVLMLLWWKKQ